MIQNFENSKTVRIDCVFTWNFSFTSFLDFEFCNLCSSIFVLIFLRRWFAMNFENIDKERCSSTVIFVRQQHFSDKEFHFLYSVIFSFICRWLHIHITQHFKTNYTVPIRYENKKIIPHWFLKTTEHFSHSTVSFLDLCLVFIQKREIAIIHYF